MTTADTSLWLHERPKIRGNSRREARPPVHCDVAIIGGGVAGVMTAFHTSRLGLSVAVLERTQIAARASGRNDGQVLLGLGEHLNRIVGQWGERRGLELWRFLDENQRALTQLIRDEDLPCDFVQEGGIRLSETAAEQAELIESASLMERAGISHRLHDRDELARLLPLGREFHGGLFLAREAIFDPAAFVVALAERAQAAGATLIEDNGVRAVQGSGGEFELTLDDHTTLRCSIVVHATSALAPDLDRSGFLAKSVFPFRGQVLATNELPEDIAARMPRWAMSSNFCYEYFRMHGNRMTLGGMRWSVKGEETGTTDDTKRNPEVSAKLRAYLARHFPDIAAHGIAREWTGIMAGTSDGLPLLGELPGRPGEYACLAFNGYGMSFAFLAGLCIAEMIDSGRASHPTAVMFRPDRF